MSRSARTASAATPAQRSVAVHAALALDTIHEHADGSTPDG